MIAEGSVTAVCAIAFAAQAGGQMSEAPPAAKPSINECLPETGSRSWCGDDGPALSAKLAGPSDVTTARNGDLVIADTLNNVIRRVRPKSIVSIGGTGERKQETSAQGAAKVGFAAPEGVATAPDGAILVADTGNNAVRSISLKGIVTTLVSAEGPVRVALNAPRDLVVVGDGSYYISDSGSNRVLLVTKESVQVVAGTAVAGYTGDGGPASTAQLRRPTQIALAPDGSVYIADTGNDAVRRVLPSGMIETVTRALRRPTGVYAQPSGKLLVSNGVGVHLVAPDGTVTQVAGGSVPGYDRDSGSALGLRLDTIVQIAPRPDGSLALAERGSDRIRTLDATVASIATAAGSGKPIKLLQQTIPPRPFPASLRAARPLRDPFVALSAQASKCSSYDARFATFNLAPATTTKLQRKARRLMRFSFKTSRKANVRIELYRKGSRVVSNVRKRVPVMPKSKSRRISVRFKKGRKVKGEYVIRLWGVSVGNGVRRCDSRRARIK